MAQEAHRWHGGGMNFPEKLKVGGETKCSSLLVLHRTSRKYLEVQGLLGLGIVPSDEADLAAQILQNISKGLVREIGHNLAILSNQVGR